MLLLSVPVDPVYALPSVWRKLDSTLLAFRNCSPLEVILLQHKEALMQHLESMHLDYDGENGKGC